MDSEQTSVNIGQLLGVLRRRAVWILVCVLIAGGGAYALSKSEAKKYTTSASLIFGSSVLSEELAGLQPVVSAENTVQQEKTDVRLVRGGSTAAKTAVAVGHGLTVHTLTSAVAVAAEPESNVVNVTVTYSSPALAAKIANTYAHIFVEEQRRSTDNSYSQAQAFVQKQLAALPPSQRLAARGIALQERSESLAALAAGPGNVQLGPVAAVPTAPSSPRVSRNTALGAVLGLLVGLALALLLELLDRRIRVPRDLEELYGVPLLAGQGKGSPRKRA
jgi:capsular polysaccharide biosynthesis protein